MLIHSLRFTLLILVFSILSSEVSYACSCIGYAEFAEGSKGQTVIRGKIDSYGTKITYSDNTVAYESMRVTVDELIQGSFSHTTMEFFGGNGSLCRTNVDPDTYPIGSEHLFTVWKEDQKQWISETQCGEFSIPIIDGRVKGRKLGAKNWIEYSIEYNDFIKSMTPPKILTEPRPLQEIKAIPKSKPWWKFW